jgi:hypothetical protein
MLCSLIADLIVFEAQCGQCLWKIVSDSLNTKNNGRRMVLLCFVEEYWIDVVLLVYQFDCFRGSMW